jgi:hypothetical protein
MGRRFLRVFKPWPGNPRITVERGLTGRATSAVTVLDARLCRGIHVGCPRTTTFSSYNKHCEGIVRWRFPVWRAYMTMRRDYLARLHPKA